MFLVMSATTFDGSSTNNARCYELNATKILTLYHAEQIALERNAAEKAAGHDNVQWFVCKM